MSDENVNNSVEQDEALEIDFSLCCPDPETPAEPYHAIMMVNDDGKTDGTLWGQGTKLMLFDDIIAARKILEALNNSSFQLRGVSKAHLGELKKLEESGRAELFVIVGFTPRGDIEAMPLAEHLARVSKAGNPPPLPRR
ncbi:MAG: hypothetical protein IJM59_12825 [Proteobacteria bacterium]|nr:hypothetical protein [Pseudomonadota bacterium]